MNLWHADSLTPRSAPEKILAHHPEGTWILANLGCSQAVQSEVSCPCYGCVVYQLYHLLVFLGAATKGVHFSKVLEVGLLDRPMIGDVDKLGLKEKILEEELSFTPERFPGFMESAKGVPNPFVDGFSLVHTTGRPRTVTASRRQVCCGTRFKGSLLSKAIRIR